jgi:methionine sulfoxide reductase heme-binding subunit
MKRLRFTPVQIAAHAAALALLAWLAYEFSTGRMGINPIQTLTQRTGKIALIFLVTSLACSPLSSLLGLRQFIPARRTLGLYAFTFAALHFYTFAGLDFQFNWTFLQAEFLEKPYIWVGLTALLILFVLAATSFRWWMKRLGRNWKRLHRLAYLAGGLVVVHYAWASKGEVLRLQGDILQPLLFGVVVAILLVVRLPVVKQRLLGRKLAARRSSSSPGP